MTRKVEKCVNLPDQPIYAAGFNLEKFWFTTRIIFLKFQRRVRRATVAQREQRRGTFPAMQGKRTPQLDLRSTERPHPRQGKVVQKRCCLTDFKEGLIVLVYNNR